MEETAIKPAENTEQRVTRSIGQKLIISFLIVAFIALIIGIVGIYGITTLKNDLRYLGNNRIPDLQALAALNRERMVIRADTLDVYQYEFQKNASNKFREISEKRKKSWEIVDKAFTELLRIPRQTERGKQLLSTLNQQYKVWRQHYAGLDKTINELSRTFNDEAKKTLYTRYREQVSSMVPDSDAMGKTFDLLTENNTTNTNLNIQKDTQMANRLEIISMVSMVVGFIISVFLGVIISRSISKPMKRASEILLVISQGDLREKTEEKYLKHKDEIGLLLRSLDKMQNNLIGIITDLNDVSSNLAASSEEIASSSQNLAEGAQSQSASVEETSASIEELGSSIIEVANNAVEVNEKSEALLKTAENSAVLVDNAISGMEKINESSQQISEILSVINDIADQTNLLALNAAIEAARAGEHGRGFAVVADEISKLAEKSTENSKEIEKLIKQSIKDVSNGSEIVRKAGEAFSEIINGVNANSRLIDGITRAVEQQKIGSEQVQKAIESINDITQNTSASAEEMAASTEELQTQAEKISIMIDAFKTA